MKVEEAVWKMDGGLKLKVRSLIGRLLQYLDRDGRSELRQWEWGQSGVVLGVHWYKNMCMYEGGWYGGKMKGKFLVCSRVKHVHRKEESS